MKVIGAIIITVLTSLFFFPFECSLMPSVNTKLAMAIVGVALFLFNNSLKQSMKIDKSLVSVIGWAALVSLVGLLSVVINDTPDYTYASYIVSAMVWISAAYVVIEAIRACYGKVDLRLVSNFLIAVCVIQCIISQLTDSNEAVADWVKGFVVSEGFMGIPDNRLYGIGCALDVAGLKFCAVLILLSYFAFHPSGKINRYVEIVIYIVSFVIISVFGSMISRTTVIGTGLAILLWIVYPIAYPGTDKSDYTMFLRMLAISLMVLIPIGVYMYHTDEAFYTNIRFGFEGFFSLVEKGRWEVRSNEMLKGMWIWPDNMKTWLIGDGYFDSTRNNPFYIGTDYIDYYKGTDIGYCRFVFYFGLLGLATFSSFFINCAYQCSRKIPKCTLCFFAILIVNFIGWAKVSSDIFPIYALILLLPRQYKEKEI